MTTLLRKPILVGSYKGKDLREYFDKNSRATGSVETDDLSVPAAYILKSIDRKEYPRKLPQRIAYLVGENEWRVTDIPMNATITKLKTKGTLR